jgi:hypothetical protein
MFNNRIKWNPRQLSVLSGLKSLIISKFCHENLLQVDVLMHPPLGIILRPNSKFFITYWIQNNKRHIFDDKEETKLLEHVMLLNGEVLFVYIIFPFNDFVTPFRYIY